MVPVRNSDARRFSRTAYCVLASQAPVNRTSGGDAGEPGPGPELELGARGTAGPPSWPISSTGETDAPPATKPGERLSNHGTAGLESVPPVKPSRSSAPRLARLPAARMTAGEDGATVATVATCARSSSSLAPVPLRSITLHHHAPPAAALPLFSEGRRRGGAHAHPSAGSSSRPGPAYAARRASRGHVRQARLPRLARRDAARGSPQVAARHELTARRHDARSVLGTEDKP